MLHNFTLELGESDLLTVNDGDSTDGAPTLKLEDAYVFSTGQGWFTIVTAPCTIKHILVCSNMYDGGMWSPWDKKYASIRRCSNESANESRSTILSPLKLKLLFSMLQIRKPPGRILSFYCCVCASVVMSICLFKWILAAILCAIK